MLAVQLCVCFCVFVFVCVCVCVWGGGGGNSVHPKNIYSLLELTLLRFPPSKFGQIWIFPNCLCVCLCIRLCVYHCHRLRRMIALRMSSSFWRCTICWLRWWNHGNIDLLMMIGLGTEKCGCYVPTLRMLCPKKATLWSVPCGSDNHNSILQLKYFGKKGPATYFCDCIFWDVLSRIGNAMDGMDR